MTFIEFCKQLGVKLTPAQRVLAMVAFDGVEPATLRGTELELARRLFGPVHFVPATARAVLVAVCGARSGKTYVLGALYSLWRALVADLSRLAPGEQASALGVSPDLRLARQWLRYALGAAQSVPSIARLIESESSDSFVMRRPDGHAVAVEVLPATRGGSAVRGRSLVSAVLDECAFFRDDSAIVNDQDVFRAVAPRVLAGGLVVLASTPWLEAGLLYAEHARNWGHPATALAVHAPTELMRPDPTTQMLVQRERERDATNAEREFDAKFVHGGAGLLFGPELLGPAVRGDVFGSSALPQGNDGRASHEQVRASIGGDIGLVQDASAFVAVHRTGDTHTVADMLEIKPSRGAPLKLSDVVKAGCDFAGRHGERRIHVDHHVLEPAREHLPKGFHLVACEGGQGPKTERWLRARDLLREGHVVIPGEYAALATQLADVIARPLPGGGTQITLPRRMGTHLDVAAAFCLALWSSSQNVPVASIRRILEAMDGPRTSSSPFEPPLRTRFPVLSRFHGMRGRGFG